MLRHTLSRLRFFLVTYVHVRSLQKIRTLRVWLASTQFLRVNILSGILPRLVLLASTHFNGSHFVLSLARI